MQELIYILSLLLIIFGILPFIKHQHWIFRVPEFMKIQILCLQIPILAASFIYNQKSTLFWIINLLQLALISYHLYILIRYTKFYKNTKVAQAPFFSENISLISCNVYQFNKDYKKFHQLIRKYQPEIFITMESNSDWEISNRSLEKDYPYCEKVTLENTYGMHLYSKIPIDYSTSHFFVADDLPSIEAHFTDSRGHQFCVFAVHPPPPSPTEETTSKERDGDLLCVAKKVKKNNLPTIVIGDFNTVAWSETSILFRKTSQLIDARVGRGILATFHARYWFFRVPLDLLFHSPEIFIEKLKILENIGSDHFPIYCKFHINHWNETQQEEVKTLSSGEDEEVEELIEEGKNEESSNREEFAEK